MQSIATIILLSLMQRINNYKVTPRYYLYIECLLHRALSLKVFELERVITTVHLS